MFFVKKACRFALYISVEILVFNISIISIISVWILRNGCELLILQKVNDLS
jgi:hypothetical protein